MAAQRQAILDALDARLRSLVPMTFAVMYRRYVDVDSADTLPALCLITGDEQHEQRPNQPAKVTIRGAVVIYAKCDAGPGIVPDDTLNPLISAVEDALKRQTTDQPGQGQGFQAGLSTTLGGYVSHCWISGTVKRFGLAAGETQLGAVIPLEILTVSP